MLGRARCRGRRRRNFAAARRRLRLGLFRGSDLWLASSGAELSDHLVVISWRLLAIDRSRKLVDLAAHVTRNLGDALAPLLQLGKQRAPGTSRGRR